MDQSSFSSFETVDLNSRDFFDLASLWAEGASAAPQGLGLNTPDPLAEFRRQLPSTPPEEGVTQSIREPPGLQLEKGGPLPAGRRAPDAGRREAPSAAAAAEAPVAVIPATADIAAHFSLLEQRLQRSWTQVGLQPGEDSREERFDLEQLLAKVPVDENGTRLSVGSIQHGSETCRPCTFVATAAGCHVGIFCRFCHFKHPGTRRSKARPCKGKRDRYRNLVDKLSAQAGADPQTFSIVEDKLPPSIRCDAKKKSRLIEVVAQNMERGSGGRAAGGKQAVPQKMQENLEDARCPVPLGAPILTQWEESFGPEHLMPEGLSL